MPAADVSPSLGFGARSVGEYRLRAAAGGLASTALLVGGFWLASFENGFLLFLAAAGAVGSVAAWVLERHRPSSRPEVRYALVGTALAGGALAVLSWPDYGLVWVVATIALPVGAAGGAAGGLVAARLPKRLLVPAICLASAVLAGVGAVAVERRMPPGSYLVVQGPSTASSADALAGRVAAGLEAEADPSSDAAWKKVAPTLVTPRPGGQVSFGYDREADGRLITVLVDDEQACVAVQGQRARSYPGKCRDD